MSKVRDFLKLTGMLDIPRQEAIERQRAQLAEEIKEFVEAWQSKDRLAMLDAIADVYFVWETLYELGWNITHGIDRNGYRTIKDVVMEIIHHDMFSTDTIEVALDRVCDNNLSKFDSTLEDALETRTLYDKINHKTRFEVIDGMYVTKSQETSTYGKVLKSHKFVPVNLEDLI